MKSKLFRSLGIIVAMVLFIFALNVFAATTDKMLTINEAEDTERIRLYDTTNTDTVGIYVGTGTPNGSLTAQAGSLFLDEIGAIYINTDGATAWSQLSTGGANIEVGTALFIVLGSAAGDNFIVDTTTLCILKVKMMIIFNSPLTILRA